MSKVAIVTGGSGGIGAATAVVLATRGWDVCVGYHSDAGAAEAVAQRCRAAGRGQSDDGNTRAIAVAADVSREADVVALFQAVDTQLGRTVALVSSAGIVDRHARVDEMTGDRLQRIFAVNVVGSFLCAREAVRRMSTRHGGPGGAIVNVSSAAARMGSPGEYVDYAASKGAIDTMTIGLAREVATEGIRVNAVRPGVIDTAIHERGGQPDRAWRMASVIPMQRPGDPSEVAYAIAWLCGDEASYVTGALLDVSGGR